MNAPKIEWTQVADNVWECMFNAATLRVTEEKPWPWGIPSYTWRVCAYGSNQVLSGKADTRAAGMSYCEAFARLFWKAEQWDAQQKEANPYNAATCQHQWDARQDAGEGNCFKYVCNVCGAMKEAP